MGHYIPMRDYSKMPIRNIPKFRVHVTHSFLNLKQRLMHEKHMSSHTRFRVENVRKEEITQTIALNVALHSLKLRDAQKIREIKEAYWDLAHTMTDAQEAKALDQLQKAMTPEQMKQFRDEIIAARKIIHECWKEN